MRDYKKSVSLAVILVYIAMAFLVVFTCTLPLLAGWYVDFRGKDPRLATTILITCYPCVPFAAVALFTLRKLLKNVQNGLVLGDSNIKHLRTVAICLAAAGLIMLIAGFRYMPFFIAGFSAVACAFVVYVIKNVFDAALSQTREEQFEDVRKYYENENK